MYVIYKLLLTITHIIYSCLETLMILWCFVRKKYENLWLSSNDDFYFISNCVKSIKNIPSHLAFILIEEEEQVICFEDLANLVLWSLAAGVSIVSFYDQQGVLKRCESKLRAEVASRGGGYGDVISWGRETLNGKTQNNGLKENGTSNGCKPAVRHRLRVVLLSREDGRGTFARAANLLAADKTWQAGRGVNASIEQTDMALRLISQHDVVLPDPELAISCGPVACTVGFLPWHIRVTEFLQLRSYKDVSCREFASLLERYNSCEQRYGK